MRQNVTREDTAVVGVDEDGARAAVGCDAVGGEGVVGEEVEDFAGAGVEQTAAARGAYGLGCGERDWGRVRSGEGGWEGDVFQLDGREVCLKLGGGFR